MIDLSGSPRSRTRSRIIWPRIFPNTSRAPTLIPGDTQIAFKAWQVPTLGQRSRDPIQAADGSIWWGRAMGESDRAHRPKTDAMHEYPLPENAMPHNVTLDKAGNVWYWQQERHHRQVRPEHGCHDRHTMPDPAAKDPHTAIFDHQGILWFTLQASNR